MASASPQLAVPRMTDRARLAARRSAARSNRRSSSERSRTPFELSRGQHRREIELGPSEAGDRNVHLGTAAVPERAGQRSALRRGAWPCEASAPSRGSSRAGSAAGPKASRPRDGWRRPGAPRALPPCNAPPRSIAHGRPRRRHGESAAAAQPWPPSKRSSSSSPSPSSCRVETTPCCCVASSKSGRCRPSS